MMVWDTLQEILFGLVPTAGVVLVFYLVIRAILRADESERQAAREFGDAPAGGPGQSPTARPRNADGTGEEDPSDGAVDG